MCLNGYRTASKFVPRLHFSKENSWLTIYNSGRKKSHSHLVSWASPPHTEGLVQLRIASCVHAKILARPIRFINHLMICKMAASRIVTEVADSLGYCLKADQKQGILLFGDGKDIFVSLSTAYRKWRGHYENSAHEFDSNYVHIMQYLHTSATTSGMQLHQTLPWRRG